MIYGRRLLFVIPVLLYIFMTGCGKKEYHEARRIILVSSNSSSFAETETVGTAVSGNAADAVDAANAGGDKGMIVYYTRTGKRYHYSNSCGSGEMMSCTLEEALENGLTPCGKCVK